MGATVILLSFIVGFIVDRRFKVGAEAVCAIPRAFANLGVQRYDPSNPKF